uniref:Uncharacterized protein n=1 Tax=Tanacetum cinerariifolium TaxID=118510 RepID=A0A6L2N370_TANCI|nr:hypothetical protein [Tanacetum cinerariifolium]
MDVPSYVIVLHDVLRALVDMLLTDGAQSSRVPIPLSDNPYRAVRQSHLVDTNTDSGPLEDLRETKIPQPLPSAPSLIPPSDDLYLIVRHTHTPATIDTKFEPEEVPSETEEFEASRPSDTRITSLHCTAPSYSTTPTTRLAVRTQSTLSLCMSGRIAEASALSLSSFLKRYRSSYETPSPSSSLTLPIQKRYQGTSELVEDTKDEILNSNTKREGSEDEGPGSEDEGPGSEDGGHGLEDEVIEQLMAQSDTNLKMAKLLTFTLKFLDFRTPLAFTAIFVIMGVLHEGLGLEEEEEEATPKGQRQAVSVVVDTITDEPLGLGYEALRRRELALGEGSIPSTFEIG